MEPPGSTGPGLNACPTVPTTYTLTATDALGCKGAATHKINICTKLKVDAGATQEDPQGELDDPRRLTRGERRHGALHLRVGSHTGLSNPSLAKSRRLHRRRPPPTRSVTDAKGCKGTAQVRVLIK